MRRAGVEEEARTATTERVATVQVWVHAGAREKSLHPSGEASVVDETILTVAEGRSVRVCINHLKQLLDVTKQIKTLVFVFWNWDASIVFSVLVSFAETDININFLVSFIDPYILPC